MKKIKLGNTELKVSAISLSCMRINNIDENLSLNLFEKAVEEGINFFDHADIYGKGVCEEIFGRNLRLSSVKREDIIIQSKCGIVPNIMFDLSKEYIINSTNGILKRLNIEYLDVLLLHRPDALAEPFEIARAFDTLHKEGKVRYFGVSNYNSMQIEILKKYSKYEIITNQLQFSIAHANMISSGIEVNMITDGACNRDGSVLDYCRLENITIQAFLPFQYGFFKGVFLNSSKFKRLNETMNIIAKKYETNSTSIAAAWILKHPANMQVITGTTNIERLKSICKSTNIILTREEWYKIYMAAGYILP